METRQRPRKRGRKKKLIPRFIELAGRGAALEAFADADIRRILKDETWFGDGPPHWKNAVNSTTAEFWWNKGNNRLIAPMSSDTISDYGAAHSAISNCRPNARCGSNGCYLCARAFQRWLVTIGLSLHRNAIPGYSDRTINYVFPEGQVLGSSLCQADFDQLMARCIEAIEKTGSVSFGIFAFDISWNDDTAKFQRGVFKIPPQEYWQVHIYGFIRTNNYKAIKRSLAKLSPSDEKIRFPLRSGKLVKTPSKALSYLFKPTAFKRKPFWAVGKKKSSWRPGRSKALSTAVHVEYLQAAHRLKISRRIALINLHPIVKKAKRGGPLTIALRPVKPKEATM